ncbi:LysR substrate-binding domain-containing protein [Pararhodobacter sp. CCB-MM2]|uniref:LysR substrate-binding domain-containing protein n=1 Tax=Pararhodobacter sp. CCB-MM2 TaxID=1786003 RepID=UPI00082C75FD|nr:LysR substrate-binding domain-containing protein [Pararhodobacter sp. CCB-MM2]
MTPDFTLANLRTLLAIADTGSFEAAAERVGRTQSAVTQQMQKLEAQSGTSLFRTDGRRRLLTPAGETLVVYAREILSMSRYALAAMEQADERGVLRLGAPPEVADGLLPPVLARFAEAMPSVRLILNVGRSPELMTMVQEGRLDATISTRRSDVLDSRLIASLKACWIAAPNFDWDRNLPVPLILADEPSMFRRIALAALDVNGLSYVERVTTPSLAGVRLAVASGLGITARTQSAFTFPVRILGEERGLPPLPMVNYYLYKARHDAPPAVNLLVDLFEAERQRQHGA